MKIKHIILTAITLTFAIPAYSAEPDFMDPFDNGTGSNIGGVNTNMSLRQTGELAPLEWAVKNAYIEVDGRFVFVTNPPDNAWAILDYDLNAINEFTISFKLNPDYDFSSQQKLDVGINFGIPSTDAIGHPFEAESAKHYMGFQRIADNLRIGFWSDGTAAFDEFVAAPDLESFTVEISAKKSGDQWEFTFKVPEADTEFKHKMPKDWQPGYCSLFARNGARTPAMAVFDDFSLSIN